MKNVCYIHLLPFHLKIPFVINTFSCIYTSCFLSKNKICDLFLGFYFQKDFFFFFFFPLSNNTNIMNHMEEPRSLSHALHYGWVFWFMHRSPGEKITNYEAAMKKIATFNTVRGRKYPLVALSSHFLYS